jgi:hypothetical protein
MSTPVPAYSHTQKAPLWLLFVLPAGASFALAAVTAWYVPDPRPPVLILVGVGAVLAFLGLTFRHLTVEDAGDRLAIRFGPLPLFRRTVRYADVERVEAGRTIFLDGWGIHCSLRGGWVWNLWGWDCVVVYWKDGGVLRIGTDDAPGLGHFLEGRITPAPASSR